MTYKDGKPYFHIHTILGGPDYNCYGGHLFAAKVAVVCEINIRLFNGEVSREFNEKIGLAHCAIP